MAKKLRAKALYAYTARGPTECSFAAGEIIEVETRGPAGNWSRSTKGAFPTDYVEFIEETDVMGGSSAARSAVSSLPPPERVAQAAAASSTAASSMASASRAADPFAGMSAPSAGASSAGIQAAAAVASTIKPSSSAFDEAQNYMQSRAADRSGVPAQNTPPRISTQTSQPLPQTSFQQPSQQTYQPQQQYQQQQQFQPQQQQFQAQQPPPSQVNRMRADFVDHGSDSKLDPAEYALSLPGKPASNPVWRQFLFMDMFADYNVDQIIPDMTSIKNSPVINRVKGAANLVFRALNHLPAGDHDSEDMRYVVNHAKKCFSDCVALCDRFPAKTADHNHLFVYLSTFMTRLGFLGGGDAIIVPTFFVNESGAESAVLIIVKRDAVGSDYDFSLSVVNTHVSGGLGYHAVGADSKEGNVLYNMAFTFTAIPNHKIRNTMFWFLVFKSAVQPTPKFNHVFFYERLLPYLTSKPILASIQQNLMDFDCVPVGGDNSYIHSALFALKHFGRLCGLNEPQSKHLVVAARWSVLRFVQHDLNIETELAPGEVGLLRIATKSFAMDASVQAAPNSGTSLNQIKLMLQCVEQLDNRLNFLDQMRMDSLPIIDVSKEEGMLGGCEWPSFGRYCRDIDVETLAGEAAIPKILRPVEMTLVPDHVSSFNEVANCLRHCVNLCTLLANQRTQIRNSYTLRACLIQHIFTRVIPIPLPVTHPEWQTKCFWRAQSMRYETQSDILRMLNLVCRHYATSVLSIKLTKAGDAARILVFACMAAVCDATLRKIACDIPSQSSLHYSGEAAGPVQPFGFEVGEFASESEYLQFNTPELSSARTQVLDYFTQLKFIVADDHMMFRFDKGSMCGPAETRYINQVSLQMGYELNREDVYISGELPDILENYPEIGYFRDLVFMFKLMMVPTSDALPELRPWIPADARLIWTAKQGEFTVYGFNKKLDCTIPELAPEEGTSHAAAVAGGRKDRGFLSRILRFVGLKSLPRASPSKANPSVLAGERVDTEDDVLHLKTLPTFDETLGARDSEHLLQYLTAPYLRIPLLLKFFSNETRLKCLRVRELQDVMDATLFEPGRWQEEYNKKTPTSVPAPDRDHLSTAVGLLFNEIIMSPSVVLTSVQTMLEKVLEMDTGKYSELSESILYIMRMAIRVEGYLLFLFKNHEYNNKIRSGEVSASSYQGAYQEAQVRGLKIDDAFLKEAIPCQQALREVLDKKAFKMLARWIKYAKIDGQMNTACMLHAHMAFIFRNIEKEALNPRVVFAIMASQTFLYNNFEYNLDVEAATNPDLTRVNSDDAVNANLGIPQIELFDMFQRNRSRILDWLSESPADVRNSVMDAIVQLIEEGKKGGKQIQSKEDSVRLQRNWVSINQPGFKGKFVPDTELPDFDKCLSKKARTDFGTWLREITTSVIDTEINAQFGEFSIKKHAINPLDQRVMRDKDFVKVFSDVAIGDLIQCAEVVHTTNRNWVRLIGMGYDVQEWMPDDRIPNHNLTMLCNYDMCSAVWLRAIIDPLRDRILPGATLYVRGDSTLMSSSDMAILYGYAATPKPPPEKGQPVKDPNADSKDPNKPAPAPSAKEQWATLKEIIVYRYPRVVHIFNVVSYGRRFYRTQIYTSSQSFSLHDVIVPPKTALVSATGDEMHEDEAAASALQSDAIVAGGADSQRAERDAEMAVISGIVPKSRSVVILREVGKAGSGFETFIPHRYLAGVIPDALMKHYAFWQRNDGTIFGHMSASSRAKTNASKSVLIMKLKQEALTVDRSGFGNSFASATISRVALLEDPTKDAQESQFDMTPDPSKPTLYLVNLLMVMNKVNVKYRDEAGTRLFSDCVGEFLSFDGEEKSIHALCRILIRLDSVSHILAWSKTNPAEGKPVTIDLVELPRLRLTFEKQTMADGTVRYNTLEQTGLWLASFSKQLRYDHLLEGLPHSVVLTNADQDHFVLLPATAKPIMMKVASDGFTYQLSLNRMNKEWINNCGESAHFVYLIHISGGFLVSRSVASSLYLLLFQTIMRKYNEAFKLIETCVCDTTLTPQESQFFKAFGMINESLYPESHALRLKFMFVSHGCSDIMPFPFDLQKEIEGYVRRRKVISAQCRLDPEEEAFVLSMNKDPNNLHIVNRERLIRATFDLSLDRASTKNPEYKYTYLYPPMATPHVCMDDPLDIELLDTNKPQFKTWVGKFSIVKYEKPKDMTGVEAIKFLMEILEQGLDLRGKNNGLGFFFLYELLNNTMNLTILPDDTPHNLGSVLLRILPDDVIAAAQGFTGMSQQFTILRIMAENPDIAALMPNFEDKRKLKLPSLAGLDIFQTHVKNSSAFLRSKITVSDVSRLVMTPKTAFKPELVVNAALPPDADKLKFSTGRHWISPRILDFNLDKRQFSSNVPPFLAKVRSMFSEEDIIAVTSTPLDIIGLDKYVERKSLVARGIEAVSAQSPLEVMQHPSSRSHIARTSVARLEQDISDFASDENSVDAPVLKVVGDGSGLKGQALDAAINHVQALGTALVELRTRDWKFAREGIDEVVASTNSKGQLFRHRLDDISLLGHSLALRGGVETSLVGDYV